MDISATNEVIEGSKVQQNGKTHLEVYKNILHAVPKQKENLTSKPQGDCNSYYGIHVPCNSPTDNKGSHVFTNYKEVLEFLKQNKKATFKAFTNEEDAIYFAKNGSGVYTHTKPNIAPSQSTMVLHEKSIFKTLKPQELVKFRKAIEMSDFPLVKKLVEENPRYLVSSGDTPSILKEGPRYNALHVAALCNAADIASYILNLISTSELTDRIYGIDRKELESYQRPKFLLDLFLNTPDKSLNETPLHFASKTGSLGVVKVLIFYPECDKNRKNKHDLTPLDVVCTRASGTLLENKEKIIKLLKDNYYIPVLRSRDNTMQPKIGDPITVSHSLNVFSVINETASSPRVEIKALAGPMSREEAVSFRKLWSSPLALTSPRIHRTLPLLNEITSPTDSRDPQTTSRYFAVSPNGASESSPVSRPSLYDLDKGLERIGKELASQFNVQWIEYWPFLDAFVDISSNEGLQMLEEYLRNKFQNAIYNSNANHSQYSLRDDKDNEVILNSKKCTDCHKFCLPTKCFQNYLESVAKRISVAISNNLAIHSEIYHLQCFLTNYSKDKRFECVDLSKAHYILAQDIVLNLRNEFDRKKSIEKLEKIIETHTSLDMYLENNDAITTAIRCIVNNVKSILSLEPKALDNEVESSYLHSKCCNCKMMQDKRRFNGRPTLRRRLSYEVTEEQVNHETSSGSTLEHSLCTDSIIIGMNSLKITDSDSDDDSLVTPPNSQCSSDDEFSELAPTVRVFLEGDKPSKLDASVLNVIENVSISCEKYPFVYFWKQDCEIISNTMPRDKWPSHNMKSHCTPTKRTLAREFHSPTWSR